MKRLYVEWVDTQGKTHSGTITETVEVATEANPHERININQVTFVLLGEG
jgi:hypothetical protein